MFKRLRLVPADEGYLPYLWLVYMGMTFVYPAIVGSRIAYIETAAGAAVFLVAYFYGYWVDGPALWPVIGTLTIIGIVLGIENPFACTYFVYAASFAPFVGTPRLGWRIIAGLIGVIAVEAVALHLTPYFWASGAVFTAIVGASAVHSAEVRRINAELRTAREDVEHLAKIAERERIARDLHDVLGHTLSVIVLKSELAARLAETDVARAASEIREVERVARESLGELREALAGYRAAGLTAEIERARSVLQAAGVRFDCDVADVRFSPRTESVLALALREAVTNVVRHAQASSCRLTIAAEPRSYRVEICDDGNGRVAHEGLGLAGMRERIEQLGGTLLREAANGTRLVLMLPRGADR